MMQLFTRGQLVALTGCPGPTLDSLCRSGELVAALPSTGRGVQRRYSAVQVFSVGLARWLRSKGWTVSEAHNVRRAILAIPHDRLLAAFAEGKTHLLIVNGSCLPLLWHESLITADNPVIAEAAQAAAQAGIKLKVKGLDLATAWADFQSKLNRKARTRREGVA